MIKISALNKESEEESRSEEEVTREALEQIALQQYAKALELQRKGNLTDATQLLKDLLDTELLDGVKKPAPGEKITSPLFNLKYLCFKNLASMLSSAGEVSSAIDAYCAATELDDTDVTLWHRLGQLCLQAQRYEMALHVFQRSIERNPRHWPCLDKLIVLLLGLDYKEECISTIYDALQLDPDYLRGLVYRRHIYKTYPHVREFMEYLNPIYKWDENDDEPLNEENATKLLNEAKRINEIFLEQQKAEQFQYFLPELKLKRPISKLTWESVGESLVYMHHYMDENALSHACPIEVLYEKEKQEEPKEVTGEDTEKANSKPEENPADIQKEKVTENGFENGNNELCDKDKTVENEKLESDAETPAETTDNSAVETAAETASEPKKRPAARRRGSALSFLEQWEWCTKRRSGRKKPANTRHDDGNIYETLRKMVPPHLTPDAFQNEKECGNESSADISAVIDEQSNTNQQYFGTDAEQTDVKMFINKYTENKTDIIDILKDYLEILGQKWRVKWPENLAKIFIEANKCYNTHIDVPACTDDNSKELLHYATVNLLVEEFIVNEKLNAVREDKLTHDTSVIESIGMILNLKPNIFSSIDILEFTLRHHWVKLHIHILNKCDDFALDYLYQLTFEFEAMGEHQNTYSLQMVNFAFKPVINEAEIAEYIKFLERNKKLSKVMELYERGCYEEVLTIIIDSFEHCKDLAKNQEEEMSLDFAVQLTLILDTFWALDKVDSCFKWSLICLHEALKHYFRLTSTCSDYEKWTLTVVKVLCCMEHILTTEGLTCLDSIPPKDLSQGLEDLIRIIGHQVETNAAEMPFGTVVPWIIMHYILQREEDQGRSKIITDKDTMACDEVPNSLMVLFIAHEHLGNRGWCCKSEGRLLYFILDTVVPRLRSPSLSKSLEQVCQYMEQIVYCLYGHPNKKNKVKHLADHNVSPSSLDWKRAQQLYEIFRPPTLPILEGKISGITADTEQLFHRILALLPTECDPQKYVPEVEKYIKGIEDKLPTIPPLLPYKMKDIYFLLGDYYFKKEEGKMAVKYNILDVIVNNDRLESWAEISLAKAVNLERILNSCKNLNNEREILNPAKNIIRCFKRALNVDPTHCNLWIEYGIFTYAIHSFCSRVLKQASESLSMEDFEALEKQKEELLDTTHKCFMTVLGDLNNSNDSEKANEDSWLQYYMLGKVAEKRNRPPSEYLDFYMQGVKSLQEADATYPLKINYSSPAHLCIEVLELHYRIHASILKYIEQHENKPIPMSVGKVFTNSIEEWKNGPFAKKSKKDSLAEDEKDGKPREPFHAANILKRSISDAGEEDTKEVKKMKQEAAAAKIKRSASYETEKINKEINTQKDNETTEPMKPAADTSNPESNKPDKMADSLLEKANIVESKTNIDEDIMKENESSTKLEEKASQEKEKQNEVEKKESGNSSSSSSSDSSSSDSSSESSSESSRDSDTSTKSVNDKPMPEEETMKIVAACLDALEDCASRFPPHYKAIYRLAHYHFYYKKGKDIERCRDLMLSTCILRSGQKLAGLFSERKTSNFFNNIWKIPITEVDRAGGFAFHMSRSALLTMEILKEIDDQKTLLDLSLYLQRIPEPDKKYLRDSDREELAQQAFSYCVQSLKGQLTKFSQQADLKSNEVERKALKSLMLDIYRAYQRANAQKQPNSKQFTNLLVEAYKLVNTMPLGENLNLVDTSIKYCQSLIQSLKQQATQASLDKSQQQQKKNVAKMTPNVTETTKAQHNPPKTDAKASTSNSVPSLPKMSPHEMAAAFQSFLPVLNDPVISHQTAAALSYLSNISALANYSSLQNTLQSTLQNSLQNSFQTEFYRQYLTQSLSCSFNAPPPKKQKRGPKPNNAPRLTPTSSAQSKSFGNASIPSVSKASSTGTSSLQKSNSAPLVPTMGKVLPSLPASMTANLSSFGASTSHTPSQAHMSTASTVDTIHTKPPLPHQQVSSGKTLQEKLAERQKILPAMAKNSKDITASISKLPPSLTITKTAVPKSSTLSSNKIEGRKVGDKPKPIDSDEVIVLDDD